MEIKELKFVNSDATPKIEKVYVAAESVPVIMAWYGGYFSGDRYAVYFDGVKLEKDQNGQLISIIP